MALINTLLFRVRDLESGLKKLQDENQELKGRLAQTSQNSHRPPSTDPPDKTRPKSLRKASTRKPGGQPGHPGRTLQRVKDPDQTELHPLCICPNCRGRA